MQLCEAQSEYLTNKKPSRDGAKGETEPDKKTRQMTA